MSRGLIKFFSFNNDRWYAGSLGCVHQHQCSSPDDHDDAIEDIVGVLDVAKRPVNQHLQQHLQREQAGEHDVTYLQCIGQLIRLEKRDAARERQESG